MHMMECWVSVFQATNFLRRRVRAEEYMLQELFGTEYKEYARKHPICIPSVAGLIPFDQTMVERVHPLLRFLT
jgi:hypothetical protein